MPMPKPTQAESRDEFISRCMGDEMMNQDYEAEDQRMAVCSVQWDTAQDGKALSKAVEAYKKGEGEAPTIHVLTKAITGEKVVLTKEIVDRDGEVVDIAGITLDSSKTLPLIDAHNMNGSVVENVLGRVLNIRKSQDSDGVKQLVGELKFANSPKGLIAKMLVEEGFVDSVSIGFRVYDYDHSSQRIIKSELYELSLVAVPANPAARIEKAAVINEESELEKALSNYQDIHPKIKEYRRLWLGDDLCKTLGYNKTGDELVDLQNVYELVQKGLETPARKTNIETRYRPSKAELKTVINQSIVNILSGEKR